MTGFLRVVMVVPEVVLPVVFGVWVWLRLHRPPPVKWMVWATGYVAYAAIAALIAAPLPSTMVISFAAALVNLSFVPPPETWIGPLAANVVKSWLLLALAPALVIYASGVAFDRLERSVLRARMRRQGITGPTPVPRKGGTVLRMPPRRPPHGQ